MTNKEIDEMIDWCRRKITNEKQQPIGNKLNVKALGGYELAMKAVMSYLHSKKEGKK